MINETKLFKIGEEKMSKYIYYIIRLDFEDGNWGYVRGDFGGEYLNSRYTKQVARQR